MKRIALVLLAASVCAVSAAAATIATGDIATGNGYCGFFAPCGPFWTNLLSPALTSKGVLESNGAIAFGPGNRLYVAGLNGIDVYDAGLVKSHIAIAPRLVAGLAVAANGDFVVLDSQDGSIHVLAPDGTQKRSYAPPDNALGYEASFDLAPDQCTVFYLTGNGIPRFDICRGQLLPNVPVSDFPAAARALSDGGYVVAQKGKLIVFDASDRVVRTVDAALEWPTAICFDADPRYVWVSDSLAIAKLRLSDGARIATAPRDSRVAVNGEQRPSLSELSASIPTLSPILLGALAAGLAALATLRLHG